MTSITPYERGNESRNTREQEAQRESERKLQALRDEVKRAQVDTDSDLNRIRDTYDKQANVTAMRGEQRIEDLRNRNYEAVREQQRAQTKDQSQVHQQGERELEKLTDHYRTTLSQTEREGEHKLAEMGAQHAHEADYESKKGHEEIESLRENNMRQSAAILENAETQRARQTAENEKVQTQFKENSTKSREQAQSHYEMAYTQTLQEGQKLLDNTHRLTAAELKRLKLDNTQKLDAFALRNQDPFYKVLDSHGKLEERSDEFILRVEVPEHERDHVSVTVRGDQLIFSGRRKSDDKVELAPGHTLSTDSFQSYSETFPMPWPVDPRGLSREYDGNSLVVRIPKKTTYTRPMVKAQPERLRAERPSFPKNLPIETAAANRSAEPEPLTPTELARERAHEKKSTDV